MTSSPPLKDEASCFAEPTLTRTIWSKPEVDSPQAIPLSPRVKDLGLRSGLFGFQISGLPTSTFSRVWNSLENNCFLGIYSYLRQQWGQFILTPKGGGLLGPYTPKDKSEPITSISRHEFLNQWPGLLLLGQDWQRHGVYQKQLFYILSPLHQQLLAPASQAKERHGGSHLHQRLYLLSNVL